MLRASRGSTGGVAAVAHAGERGTPRLGQRQAGRGAALWGRAVVVTDGRRFRWLPHSGRRHAIPAELAALDEGRTLCGVTVTVPSRPLPRAPHWCWPTCDACDLAWRAHEGIPAYPRPRRGPRALRGSGKSTGER